MSENTLAPVNQLILGDNLEIMKRFGNESVDLIYLDPPFFSNRNYEVIWGDAGEIRSFKDRWAGGIDHYITWLKERVELMYRLLKKNGSIFLHCDWHADAYIRVHILDKIFGEKNFKGEIIWKRTNAHNDAKNKLAVLKDTIWYYSKSARFIYNPVYEALAEKYTDDFYKYDDEDGKGLYSLGDLTNTRPGGYNYEYKGYTPNINGWRCPIETMQQWDDEGLIYFPKAKTGRLRIKRYLSNSKGNLLGDVWSDIQNVQGTSERIGYPTQKPEALMERIIKMASNEGDLVLDPFMGGGTTAAVADKLKRRWIGIDQSSMAVKVTEMRLDKQRGLFSAPFTVQLQKYDYETLRHKDAFEFEHWIIQQFGGTSNTKQRSDFGLDGKMPDNTPIQVKRSDNIGRNVIDNFKSAAERADKKLYAKNKKEKKPIGYIIAFSFSKGAVAEIARLKLEEGILVELVPVDTIVPIADGPTGVTVKMREVERDAKGGTKIEFIATGTCEAGIEFYAWDFDYDVEKGFNASLLVDKGGRQTHQFKAGMHTIAVKSVDNEGLESLEFIKLKVNGVVKKV